MVFAKRLKRASEGAVAIEYGLIAGIVALGIVSALVTTKGSLNGVFGMTGAQMNVSQVQSTSANAALWGGKGLTGSISTIVGNRVTQTYTYADGSKASYTRNTPGEPFYESATFFNPVTNVGTNIAADASGNMSYYQKTTYDAVNGLMTVREQTTAAGNFSGNPAVPTRYTSSTFDAAGNVLTYSGVTNVPADYVTGSLDTNESLKYFRDLNK